MPDDRHKAGNDELVLSTRLEEDFVTPLTAVRGFLELLRDIDDLSAEERRKFAGTALEACTRLEGGVDRLAMRVYAAPAEEIAVEATPAPGEFAERIRMLEEVRVIDIDQEGLVFNSTDMVNSFYDEVEALVDESGRDWYFVVGFKDTAIWPEAWVAYAHREKRLYVSHALGSVRYDATATEVEVQAGKVLPDRDAAIRFLTEGTVPGGSDPQGRNIGGKR